MRFEEVLPALREGKKVRRMSWHEDSHWNLKVLRGSAPRAIEWLADDWQVVEEPFELIDADSLESDELWCEDRMPVALKEAVIETIRRLRAVADAARAGHTNILASLHTDCPLCNALRDCGLLR